MAGYTIIINSYKDGTKAGEGLYATDITVVTNGVIPSTVTYFAYLNSFIQGNTINVDVIINVNTPDSYIVTNINDLIIGGGDIPLDGIIPLGGFFEKDGFSFDMTKVDKNTFTPPRYFFDVTEELSDSITIDDIRSNKAELFTLNEGDLLVGATFESNVASINYEGLDEQVNVIFVIATFGLDKHYFSHVSGDVGNITNFHVNPDGSVTDEGFDNGFRSALGLSFFDHQKDWKTSDVIVSPEGENGSSSMSHPFVIAFDSSDVKINNVDSSAITIKDTDNTVLYVSIGVSVALIGVGIALYYLF